MPASSSQAPNTQDYLAAYSGAIAARRTVADVHRGSRYDVLGGVAAVLFQRITTRDTDQFSATYWGTAQDTELDDLQAKRFSGVAPRVLASKGQGTIRVARASAVAGAGDFLVGTRIVVVQGASAPVLVFEVAQQTPCSAASTEATVPIQNTVSGAGSPFDLATGDVLQFRFEDPLWDNTWRIEALQCNSGTDRENDTDWRLRTRSERVDARLGYPTRIVRAMRDAGALRIALFASDYLGPSNDHGLNRIYVGDTSYVSTPDLLLNCRLATYAVCVLGTAVQVLPMAEQVLSLNVVVQLWDAADHLSRDMLSADVAAALLNYFQTRQNPFIWRIHPMEGLALKATRQQAQSVTITASANEPNLLTLFNASPLVAWTIDARRITISFS